MNVWKQKTWLCLCVSSPWEINRLHLPNPLCCFAAAQVKLETILEIWAKAKINCFHKKRFQSSSRSLIFSLKPASVHHLSLSAVRPSVWGFIFFTLHCSFLSAAAGLQLHGLLSLRWRNREAAGNVAHLQLYLRSWTFRSRGNIWWQTSWKEKISKMKSSRTSFREYLRIEVCW